MPANTRIVNRSQALEHAELENTPASLPNLPAIAFRIIYRNGQGPACGQGDGIRRGKERAGNAALDFERSDWSLPDRSARPCLLPYRTLLVHRYFPVMLFLFARIASGVPSATILPPILPPPGPISTIQSALRITSRSCSITSTVAPWSIKC